MSYPYVEFKGRGETIRGSTIEILKASCATAVDSIRIASHESKDSRVKLYIGGEEVIALNSGSVLERREAKELLDGSVIYIAKGDVVKVGLSSGHKGGVYISYRELNSQDGRGWEKDIKNIETKIIKEDL